MSGKVRPYPGHASGAAPSPTIRPLPPEVAERIAAGEVIERPASIVKELVENALDAGATAIDIAVEDGGRKLISVRDNGVGMGPEDLALAFVPHSTSKIASEEDLLNIRTMGFRGEALASIAAVSRARIVSRPRGSGPQAAHEVRAEGGTIQPVRPASAPEGTTVTVRDLFYNTPARRKFMRTANTEFGHIVEQLARLSLPQPQVAFSLTHNGRCTHRLAATEGLRQRVAEMFGAELAESLIAFDDAGPGCRVRGLLGPPSIARASGRWQYFFLNGRYIRDRRLAHALREAYRGLLDHTLLPVAFVFLEMDPADYDVNVHPAKLEVRFRRGQMVHSQLLGALRETLNSAQLAPAVEVRSPPGPGPDAEPADDPRRRSLKQALAEFLRSKGPVQAGLTFPDEGTGPGSGKARPGGPRTAAPPPPARQPHLPPPAGSPRPSVVEPVAVAPGRTFQLHNSYIVAAVEDGLVIVDQHALHERILYDELSRRLAGGSLPAQRLLIPETVEVSEVERAALTEHARLLERLGIEFTDFGPHSVAVQKFPALLVERHVPVKDFCRDLLGVLVEDSAADPEALLAKVLSTMACRAAIKAGDPLTDEEIQALLSRREGLGRQARCPHGRPTTLLLTRAELERQFGRA